jgi:5-methyltetrahydropteroyltriglutamate--homocysteine methyltransferase
LIGPVSYLLLGKEKEKGFNRLDLIQRLLPVYIELLQELESRGAHTIQIDEPYLVMDLTKKRGQFFKRFTNKSEKHCQPFKLFWRLILNVLAII